MWTRNSELLKKGLWVVGIKRWFDELFDGYLVEESMLASRVMVGKRKGLIWGFLRKKKKEKV